VDRALERCFAMKTRAMAKAKTVKPQPPTTTRISARRTAARAS
jgi:hypothetical protein